MYTYHNTLMPCKYNVKKYFCFMRDDDCERWHPLQNFKTFTIEDNDGYLRPKETTLFLNASEDLFWFVDDITLDNALEWHLFGDKDSLSSCVREPFSSHWDKRFEKYFSVNIGIVGIPLWE